MNMGQLKSTLEIEDCQHGGSLRNKNATSRAFLRLAREAYLSTFPRAFQGGPS